MSQVASGCHIPRASAWYAKNPTVNAVSFSRLESVPGKVNRADAVSKSAIGFFFIGYVR